MEDVLLPLFLLEPLLDLGAGLVGFADVQPVTAGALGVFGGQNLHNVTVVQRGVNVGDAVVNLGADHGVADTGVDGIGKVDGGIRYCLYYVNSRGGWDSVLVDGIATQTDKYDRETYTQNYRTPSISRGVIEYRNNITESWTLYLRSLGDSRNKLFHNLYESTNVYLHDLEEGRIVPVIITSREMQYKTRKNQGKKLYSYEITVESSQRKLRM